MSLCAWCTLRVPESGAACSVVAAPAPAFSRRVLPGAMRLAFLRIGHNLDGLSQSRQLTVRLDAPPYGQVGVSYQKTACSMVVCLCADAVEPQSALFSCAGCVCGSLP